MNTLALLQAHSDLDRLMNAVDESMEATGEVSKDLADAAELATLQAEGLRDEVALVVRKELAAEAFCDQEIARLVVLRNRHERRRLWLEGVVLNVMVSRGMRKLVNGSSSFTVIQNPPKVEIGLPAEQLPAEFQRTTAPTVEPDKKAIKAALERGEDVPGARLVPGEMRIKIR